MMHSYALLAAEVRALQQANAALSKRRRAKKTRVRLGGSLTVQEGHDLLDEKGVQEQIQQETQARSGGRQRRAEPGGRRCGTCGERGQNTRTCEREAEMSDVYSSE